MVEDILKLFEEKPYTLRMGSKLISKQFKFSLEKVVEARELYHSLKKNLGRKVRILILDIETSPLRAYVWSRWKQNVYLDQTISEWFMLTWAAKWLGEKKVYTGYLNNKEIKEENDKRISEELWTLLNEADIIVAHNGKKFDIPKINSRFIINGFPPPSPYKQIDTKEVASRQFGFSSNKLDALAGYLDIEHKDETDFQLWVDVLNGNKKAMNYMVNYNIKDIIILEKIYYKLRPWIKNHPNVSLYKDSNETLCPICGSNHLEINHKDFIFTQNSKYNTIRCLDCGGISRTKLNKLVNKKHILSTI